jgi:hypothetical protein
MYSRCLVDWSATLPVKSLEADALCVCVCLATDVRTMTTGMWGAASQKVSAYRSVLVQRSAEFDAECNNLINMLGT